MAERSSIPVPLKLLLRRARYQIVPVTTMVTCTILAVWLWSRNARSSTATGEVSAIRIPIESKIEGLLEELPQPVQLFDRVSNGQVVARLDMSMVEKQVQRMRGEVERLKAQRDTPGTTQPVNSLTVGSLIGEREAQIAELQAKLDARDVKSPIDGTVMELFRRPGQSAVLGQPILTIASENADFIIGYMRENQPLRPAPGMVVTVRTRGDTSARRSFDSYVTGVAPQVMPMPPRHLYRPDFPEWALRVQVAIPAEAEVTPGEMVDLVFHPKRD